MKAVILAGGLGTRLSEETGTRPKPMVEIGGKPILWHIMKMYSSHGINDFIICCGYKGYMIKTSMTGGRLRRVADYVRNDEAFCFTYGDGVGSMDISAAVAFHKSHGKAATLTATFPPGRFGALDIAEGRVLNFKEKPKGDGAMINGGFFVLSPQVLDYLEGDSTVWEQGPLMSLAEQGQLMAFEHPGFWQPMDTLHDKNLLEKLWQSGDAPWKFWD
ncbi:MAG: glucose-1-phosphate cytidylyltransferase [Pseudomonas sp.]|nr:MAG: glucose-1-phosphate cytidylyltransferase [Pseudomonas sp.]